MPVAANQRSLDAKVEMVQIDLAPSEHVPQAGPSALRRREQIFMVGRECALDEFLVKLAASELLAESEPIADQIEVADEVVAGLHNDVALIKHVYVENEVVA